MPHTTINDVLEHIRASSANAHEQGEAFERAAVYFLKNDPLWASRLSGVWLWADAPTNNGGDTGIDVVARDAIDGSYWAIQCKCWEEASHLTYRQASTFFATAQADRRYGRYMVVDTVDSWSKTLLAKAEALGTVRIDVAALGDSAIDWSAFLHGQGTAERRLYEPRPHQRQAIDDCLEGFATHDRGKLVMACGTGKTFTALRLAEELCPTGRVLFLTPSISLVSQSLQEWARQARLPLRPFVVCSDEKASKLADRWATSVSEIPYPSTTDAALLASQARLGPSHSGLTVVFGTYQSIDVITQAQGLGLPAFDLVVCDEAHRTTGMDDATRPRADISYFTKVHHDSQVKADRRLYMTATPKVYGTSAIRRAHEESYEIASMDDEAVYGPYFHYLSFGKAVDQGLLTDYRVVVMTITDDMVAPAVQRLQLAESGELDIPEAGKMIGCWKGLFERSLANNLFAPALAPSATDLRPSRHAVAFTSTIAESRQLAAFMQTVVDSYIAETGGDARMRAIVDHIDGTMNTTQRRRLLSWLAEADADTDTCHILSNARCLTEGVDVPNLDAILFMKPRKSQTDIIQAVGRVMRRSPGKQYGYIILPVFVPSGYTPEEALSNTEAYKAVWQVVQALRSHDERLDAKINTLAFEPTELVTVKALDESKLKRDIGDKPAVDARGIVSYDHIVEEPGAEASASNQAQLDLDGDLASLGRAVNAMIAKKCGTRVYWADWAGDVARIAEGHVNAIREAVGGLPKAGDASTPATPDPKAAAEFARFLAGLRESLNPGISESDAIEMLAQHIITLPVFEALFGGEGFAASNPVSIAMEQMVAALGQAADALQASRRQLDDLYYSVAVRASQVTSDAGRQGIIKELYESFFSQAFKATAERMGIVYTPNEVVDYMLHATDRALRREFGVSLGSPGVHILDPFAGTGTFLVNLIASGLVGDGELAHKYAHELHSNEIVLLAYYIMVINIEHAYHARAQGGYQPYPGAVLADTFQTSEDSDTLDIEVFADNSERMLSQAQAELRVIIGNPPYSVGQRSANDDNANQGYPRLDKRIADTYAAATRAMNKNSLYDSYIRAFRWATDRLGERGVICFVTNAGWLDAAAMGGFRRHLTQEFASVHVLDLRGNQRTQGEESRREGGKVFGSGSRTPIAVTILVKDPDSPVRGRIHYHDVGDYLTRDEKLAFLRANTHEDGIPWVELAPDAHDDWLNQRDEGFARFAPLGIDKHKGSLGVFATWSNGNKTQRDPWAVNFSKAALADNMARMIEAYNQQARRHQESGDGAAADMPVDNDPAKISWTRRLLDYAAKGTMLEYKGHGRTLCQYRPFNKQWMYYDRELNERTYQQPRLFPMGEPALGNLVIVASERGAFITDCLPDVQLLFNCQCFPLYWYERAEPLQGLFADGGQPSHTRHDAITDEALRAFRQAYGDHGITKEDVFHYAYGVLHSPEYRRRFAANLAKGLPRIPLARSFRAFSEAGRELARLHVNYEAVEPWPLAEEGDGADPGRTVRMRLGKAPKTEGNPRGEDRSVLHVSERLTLRGIPEEAWRYEVNGKPAIGWLIDRYQVTTDKASGIVNDPNGYSDDPRYIVDLVARVVRVSIETMQIVDGLPALDEMEQPAFWPKAWGMA